ncbi:MAG: hypothetical protein AB7E96_07125 [Deferribacterales bacterium]
MNSSTDTQLILNSKGFFLLNGRTKTPADSSALDTLKPGFRLVIDDSVVTYTHMQFPQSAGKNPAKFIENFLLTGFPQDMIKDFGFYRKGEHILIALFDPSLTGRADIRKAMERAGSVTTPLTMLYSVSDNFIHSFGSASVEVRDDVLTHIPPAEPTVIDIPVTTASLSIPSVKKNNLDINRYKLPVAAALLCWLLFFSGYYFRLHDKTDRLKAAEAMLNDVYVKAGTADTPDPYGMLMAKAAKKDSASAYAVTRILEQISRTQTDAVTATSIDIKSDSVTYEGTARDFAFIEDFKKKLSIETGKNVTIINTKKGEGAVSFTLRF